MAKRIINPPAFEIEIENLEGKAVLLRARHFTKQDYVEFVKLSEGVTVENSMEKLIEQASFIFGGSRADYEKYDIRVVRALIDSFTEDLRRPLTPQA